MIKEIVHDPIFLAGKSFPATKEDLPLAKDLLDTLVANREGCVGMAANMIGERKCIIVFDNDGEYMTMFNPEILKSAGLYETEEGCLSLLGGPRKCKRYQSIKVKWQTENFETRIKTFTDWPAQIIQHEIDHCNGILI
ncbi:MAG: peptide deformylase [Clostridia bacterium]|nr:peptide deformylase [Clostridia bacterium]